MARAAAALMLALLLATSAAVAQTSIDSRKGYAGPPSGPYQLGGLSFTSEPDLDVLRMHIPVGITPQVFRHAIPQRVVLRFDNTQPLASLTSLVQGKHGDCVEKFEVQPLRNYATGIGDMAGVRTFSEYSTLIVVYVPSDCDAQVVTDAGVVEAVFQRLPGASAQPRLAPITTLEEIKFESTGAQEIITFVFNAPVTPSIYEELGPHRLMLRFPAVDVTPKARNQVKRFMQVPLLFRVETFNVGSMPLLYPEVDETRDYHFTGLPSPLADDAFADKVFGKQTRDAITVLYPFENTTFEIPETEKNVVRVVFKKLVGNPDPMVCTEFKPVRADPEMLYNIEDEEGRLNDDE
jgi:hypothetical protein